MRTPLPWSKSESDARIGLDPEGRYLFECGAKFRTFRENVATTKFIVEACNEFEKVKADRDRLLELAKEYLSLLESDWTGSGGRDYSNGAIAKAREAIRISEGDKQ